jgi:hypothetical protein
MSVDRNAMAVALIDKQIDEDELFIALDELLIFAKDVIEKHPDILDDTTKNQIKSKIQRLKPIMNATFRPVGLNSDPFKPRYIGVKIHYYANEYGYSYNIADEQGKFIFGPISVELGSEDYLYRGALDDDPSTTDLTEGMSKEEVSIRARSMVEKLGAIWELPINTNHVVWDESLAAHIELPIAKQSTGSPRP